MSLAERLKEPVDPFLDDRSFEEFAQRAHDLMKRRDELLFVPDHQWTDELDDELTRIEWHILNDWYPWLVEVAAEKRVKKSLRKQTKKKRLKVMEQMRSSNVDSRRLGYSKRATLGEFWPERKEQQ